MCSGRKLLIAGSDESGMIGPASDERPSSSEASTRGVVSEFTTKLCSRCGCAALLLLCLSLNLHDLLESISMTVSRLQSCHWTDLHPLVLTSFLKTFDALFDSLATWTPSADVIRILP